MWPNVVHMAMRSVTGFNGAKLLARRAELGLTQQELSDETAKRRRRIHRDTISKYENGEAAPTALNLGMLAVALNCQPAALLDEQTAGAA